MFFKQAFLIPSISLNLNRNIPTTQLALRHNIYLLELKPKHTNNTASSASCHELHTEKLTVRSSENKHFYLKRWFKFQYSRYSMYSNCICILTLSWKYVPVIVLPVGDLLIRYRNWQGDTWTKGFLFCKV